MDWCKFFSDILINILPSLKELGEILLYSPLIAAAAAAYFGIIAFLSQQRISRVQKIYYEESLLDQLKHMDDCINTTNQSYSLFITAMNIIRTGGINPLTIESLTELATQIKSVPSYLSSKREVLIILFGRRGYIIHQWLFKYDRDINEFNSLIREILLTYRVTNQLRENQIQNQITEVDRSFELIRRHFVLPYLLNEIISRIGIFDFKSREALIEKIKSDKTIGNYLNKIDEAFKILFGWFSLPNNEFLSYLQDENGNRYILRLNQNELQPTQNNTLHAASMRIISNDITLANHQVRINGHLQNYSRIQIGMANLAAFNEQPQFYPEARSFENFT